LICQLFADISPLRFYAAYFFHGVSPLFDFPAVFAAATRRYAIAIRCCWRALAA